MAVNSKSSPAGLLVPVTTTGLVEMVLVSLLNTVMLHPVALQAKECHSNHSADTFAESHLQHTCCLRAKNLLP